MQGVEWMSVNACRNKIAKTKKFNCFMEFYIVEDVNFLMNF